MLELDRETLLAIDGFNDYLVDKYNAYVRKRTRQVLTGRVSYRKDGSQNKCYRAEWNFNARNGYGIEFADIEEAQKYCERIMKSKTYKELGGKLSFVVPRKNMGSRSRFTGMAYPDGRIQLSPNGGMNQYTLLHELAHQCGARHHDVKFRQILVRLVSRFMGRDMAKKLKQEFRNVGLKMSQRSTIKSPQQWLQDYFKMQKLREIHNIGGV
jgi:hypothetical protein